MSRANRAFFVCALSFALPLQASAGRLLQEARVVSVHDGDTITVQLSSGKEKVRLIGIDTPEINDERDAYREAAAAARDYARSRLTGRTVTLENDERQPDRDAYERLLRYVIVEDGANFNEEMVRTGHARVYDRFKFTLRAQFKRAEAEAKREKAGVWRLPPGPARMVPPQPR